MFVASWNQQSTLLFQSIHEKLCKSIQPICWGNSDGFFAKKTMTANKTVWLKWKHHRMRIYIDLIQSVHFKVSPCRYRGGETRLLRAGIKHWTNYKTISSDDHLEKHNRHSTNEWYFSSQPVCIDKVVQAACFLLYPPSKKSNSNAQCH